MLETSLLTGRQFKLIFLSTLFNQMLLSLKIYNNGNKEEQKVIINKNKIVKPLQRFAL